MADHETELTGHPGLPRRRCPDCGATLLATDPRWRCCDRPLLLADPIPAPAMDRLGDRPLSLWRYAEALQVPEPLWRRVSLGEGVTPLVDVDGTGSRWVKVEYANPTLSFKDRGAVLLLAAALATGAERILADSSGNAGTAAAAYAARAGLPASIYVPENTSPKKLSQIRAHGAELHVVPGNRDDCALAAAAAAHRPGVFYASHVYNPLFHVGTATFAFEVWEQLGGRLPDTFVLPAGNGTLVLGVAHACSALRAAQLIETLPKIIAVQAENCAPLARAWRAAHTAQSTPPMAGMAPVTPVVPKRTLAEGIAIAAPARGEELLRTVAEFGGAVVTVSESEIRRARSALARRGWYVEDTAAVCWAAADRLAPLAAAASSTAPSPGAAPSPAAVAALGEVVLPLSGAGLKTGWTVGD